MGPPPVLPRPTSCPRGMLSHTPSSACMPQLDRWVSSVSTWRLVRCPKDTPRLLGLALEAPHNLPPPYCCCHRTSPPPHAMLPPHPPITPPPPGQPDSTPSGCPNLLCHTHVKSQHTRVHLGDRRPGLVCSPRGGGPAGGSQTPVTWGSPGGHSAPEGSWPTLKTLFKSPSSAHGPLVLSWPTLPSPTLSPQSSDTRPPRPSLAPNIAALSAAHCPRPCLISCVFRGFISPGRHPAPGCQYDGAGTQ